MIRVGLNVDVKIGARRRGDGRLLALNPDFVALLLDLGARPVPLPPFSGRDGRVHETALAAALDELDALVLTGGDDMHPRAYGQEPHESLVLLDPARDASDLALARGAMARGLPILGICGGMQLLNVALGGTLHQHLPASPLERLLPLHRDSAAHEGTTHAITVAPESRLARVLGCTTLLANSRHHQAVDRPGRGLTACAWSEDGVIEALEAADAPWLGVQWHPEEHVGDPVHARLFSDLLAAAERTRTRGSRSWNGGRGPGVPATAPERAPSSAAGGPPYPSRT